MSVSVGWVGSPCAKPLLAVSNMCQGEGGQWGFTVRVCVYGCACLIAPTPTHPQSAAMPNMYARNPETNAPLILPPPHPNPQSVEMPNMYECQGFWDMCNFQTNAQAFPAICSPTGKVPKGE